MRRFIQDTNAITEEFTVVPSLAIIVFGIIISFLLFGQTFMNYQHQTNLINNLHSTNQLYQRIVHPSNPFMQECGTIDYQMLFTNESESFINALKKEYGSMNVNFSLHFSIDNHSFWFPSAPERHDNMITVSHQINMCVNKVVVKSSTLSLSMWKMDDNEQVCCIL